MRLVDILSAVDLSVYPEVAIVLFLSVFAWAGVRVACTPRAVMDRAARLPLEDDAEGVAR